MSASAILSGDKLYRYQLFRGWGEGSPVLFIGLNPSTADAERDDPTVRRCIGFAKRWGFGSLLIGNLFAWRATDPRAMMRAADPVGANNGVYLAEMAARAGLIVCAWGTWGFHRSRGDEVARMLRANHPLSHLGLTKTGQPKHPLYLRADSDPMPWSAP